MNTVITPAELRGTVEAIPSKSCVHRLLICAALADKPSELKCRVLSEDILATVRCLEALGAGTAVSDGRIRIVPPLRRGGRAVLDPGESGSTYRFFTPLAAALGCEAEFRLHGKLPQRPMEPLWHEMERHGVQISGRETARPCLSGQLTAGEYRLSGGVSSQFFTGLLFALPLLDGTSRIVTEGRLESAGYVDMTLEALSQFSLKIIREGTDFVVPGGQRYSAPARIEAEGDWSNAAFWLCAAAARGKITVTGLKFPSSQGDSAVLSMLRRFGAEVTVSGGSVTAAAPAAGLHGTEIDAGETPDLVPALAVAAAAARGVTRFTRVGRLRLKESDRIASVCGTLNALGGYASAGTDTITVEGSGSLSGGIADACGDHRIAMLAAAASVLCSGPVEIRGAEAVNKSYPTFFSDFSALGGRVREEGA
jgi:3-phosphoshikimate 1-carboxyvinyltransferase